MVTGTVVASIIAEVEAKPDNKNRVNYFPKDKSNHHGKMKKQNKLLLI